MSMATLEFDLPPAEAARLLRLPALAPLRSGRPRDGVVRLIWHDTAEGRLARDGLALAEARGAWRLERLRPDGAGSWPPATPAPLIAEAPDADHLPQPLPEPLMPIAAFEGRQRQIPLRRGEAELALQVLEGTLRAVANERACCRLTLSGPSEAVRELARRLAGDLPILVPRHGLAEEAMALARGVAPAPRHLGAPEVLPGTSVADAFAAIVGHLTDVVLHWSATAAHGETPEPVHQMRVGIRRLRSALAVFKRAVGGPSVQAAGQAARELAQRLGTARDWDVFLEDTATPVRAAFPDDRRIARLIEAADRRRGAAYGALAELLASAGFRRLGLQLAELAALRPWAMEADAEQAEAQARPIEDYAEKALGRRFGHMLDAGEDLAALPPEPLHQLRKDGKRMRYACEFFAPLFPGKSTRRFIKRLAALQGDLGHLNDAATARTLLDGLGSGAERAFAAGVVLGFVAARAGDVRSRAQETWDRLRDEGPYWD